MSLLAKLLCRLGLHDRQALHTTSRTQHGSCRRCRIDLCVQAGGVR